MRPDFRSYGGSINGAPLNSSLDGVNLDDVVPVDNAVSGLSETFNGIINPVKKLMNVVPEEVLDLAPSHISAPLKVVKNLLPKDKPKVQDLEVADILDQATRRRHKGRMGVSFKKGDNEVKRWAVDRLKQWKDHGNAHPKRRKRLMLPLQDAYTDM